MQSYRYRVHYIKDANNIADTLSRLLPKNKQTGQNVDIGQEYIRFVAEQATPSALSTKEIERASENDHELQEIRNCLLNGGWHQLDMELYSAVQSELSAIGKLVLRGTRIIIPKVLCNRILDLVHEGHKEVVNMKQIQRSKVWWPGISNNVEKFCKSCFRC